MTTYQKFKKLNIRHSAIGLEQSDTDVTYYCTPRDAAIIGWGRCGWHPLLHHPGVW